MRWYPLLAFIAVASRASAEESTTTSDTSSSASAEERSRQAFEAGQAAYERKDFGTAAAEFRKAYAVTPSPPLLYDLAQAERLAGQCDAALAHYRQFVATSADAVPADVDEKIAEVARCSTARVTEQPAPDRAPSPQPPPPRAFERAPPSPAPITDRSTPLPAWVGWTFAGVGVAGLVAGIVMTTMVVHRQSVVEGTCPGKVCRNQSGIDAADEGRALLIGSIASYAVGAAGLGFGIYVLAHDSSPTVPTSRTTPTGAVLSWRTAF